MITYTEYEKLRREFYAQFVDEEMKQRILRHIGLAQLLDTYSLQFSDIPTGTWVSTPFTLNPLFYEIGAKYTTDARIAILKEASLQIVERALTDVSYLKEVSAL